MAEALQPDTRDATIADLMRRVQILESTQRVGLSGVRNAWLTATAVATTLGSFETGPAAATWADDQGNTGTGYPQFTIANMPARALIGWEARPANVHNDGATYKSQAVQLALAINGLDDYTTLPGGALPKTTRQHVNTGTAAGPSRWPIMATAIRRFTAGQTYTFRMVANWDSTAPAAPTGPTLTDCQIWVLPLSAS
jgi:hypothetical protein